MTRYLVDSRVLVGVLEGRKARTALLRGLLEQNHVLVISPLTAAEVFAAYRSGSRTKADQLIRSLELLPISVEVAHRAGKLMAAPVTNGRRLTLEISVLAASAEVYGCVLLTDRAGEFQTATNAVADVKGNL